MYIRRILATAGASAVIAVGALAGAPMASASPTMTSASTDAVPAAAGITCYDYRTYDKVGRVTCKGTGLFRAKADCNWPDADETADWVRINNSASTAYVRCDYDINKVTAEIRPGA